jgi:L-asparaginase II
MILKAIAEICGCPAEKIAVAVDGCSIPAHALPLYNIALGYARLVTPNSVPREKATIYSAIYRAMAEYPDMVGGKARFDTVVAGSDGEPILSKAGAEAIQCFAIVNRHLGVAIKIADGARRALYPVAVEFLYKMGGRTKKEELREFHQPIITNMRGIEVGHIEPGFVIEEVEHD